MSDRIKSVNSLIKRELSRIILREINFPESILLVTITRAETLKNLSQVRIYVSVMPEGKRKEAFKILDENIYSLQQELNKRLKMRPIPKLEFKIEEKTKEADRIEELLEKIKERNI